MVGLEVEIVRATLVIGLSVGALVYHFTRVSSGGIVTPAFLSLLVLAGRWQDIAGWAVITLLGVGALRLISSRWPLPRSWLFYLGILITTAVHIAGIALSSTPAAARLAGMGLFISAGVYVCSGLTAYDSLRQGVTRTFLATGLVTAVTVAVIGAVQYLSDSFGGEQPIVTESPLRNPALALVCVGMAVAMRMGPRWGTAGLIGSLYLLNIASWQSVLVVIGFALVGSTIYRTISDALGLSPKERLYSLLAVGSLASWFGLFWATWLGVPGAAAVAAYPIEPLIVIGLMIGETVRYGIVRTAAGSTIVFGVTWAAASVIDHRPSLVPVVVIASMLLMAVIIGLSLIQVNRGWRIALRGGDRWGATSHNLAEAEIPETQLDSAGGQR